MNLNTTPIGQVCASPRWRGRAVRAEKGAIYWQCARAAPGRSWAVAVFFTRFIITFAIVIVRISAMAPPRARARTSIIVHLPLGPCALRWLDTLYLVRIRSGSQIGALPTQTHKCPDECRNPMCQIGGMHAWLPDSLDSLGPVSQDPNGYTVSQGYRCARRRLPPFPASFIQLASARTHTPPSAGRRLQCHLVRSEVAHPACRAVSARRCSGRTPPVGRSTHATTIRHAKLGQTARRGAADVCTAPLSHPWPSRRATAVTNHAPPVFLVAWQTLSRASSDLLHNDCRIPRRFVKPNLVELPAR